MKILLVDDEKRQSDFLKIQLSQLDLDLSDLVTTNSPIEACKLLRSSTFDLLFLDVEMPEMTGFELIEIVGAENLPPIIFTTAYAKYAVEAFKINAIDYLLKPIDLEELNRAIERVTEKSNSQRVKSLSAVTADPLTSQNNRLVIPQGQTYLFLQFDEIMKIEGSGSYSDFYLIDGRKITASKRLNHFWQRLTPNKFLRTHQSHVINKACVIGYSKKYGGEILLQNNNSVPIGGQFLEAVKRALGI